jgi:hypothetical protein
MNQSNVLAVVADGSAISLYINHQFLAETNNSAYSQGQLGIFSAGTDVEANNAMAWKL